ncbi:MAG: SagB/ThcOx family dehydrogenase, partial [Acidobacteriia bacterium]|nr:SagB/ThcOx family dehydrogenase [Terriglobia bacterium]
MTKSVGDDFQKETKYFRNKRLGGSLDWENKPNIYKEYLERRTIQLPVEFQSNPFSLMEALRKRKSTRSFAPKPVSIGDLSFLLWACTGIQRKNVNYEFRTAPSAGALYPIETYVVVNSVEDVDEGLYHYNIRMHALEELRNKSPAEAVAYAALEQEMIAKAPVVFVWTAVFERSKWKYGQRAYRYVYLDAGHIAENLALSAVSLGLGSCQIGAFFDD